MGDMFGWLTGISPWWWVAFALLLGGLEILTLAFFLIGPALAAVVVAALLAMFPELSGTVQILLFAAVSAVLTGLFLALRGRLRAGEEAGDLNDRSARMVGRQARVIRFEHGVGSVEIDGVHWQAVAHPDALGLRPGASVKVISVEDGRLRVERLAAAPV